MFAEIVNLSPQVCFLTNFILRVIPLGRQTGYQLWEFERFAANRVFCNSRSKLSVQGGHSRTWDPQLIERAMFMLDAGDPPKRFVWVLGASGYRDNNGVHPRLVLGRAARE